MLHIYTLWYRTSFGLGRRQFKCRDREHAIAVAKSFCRTEGFSVCEDDPYGYPFFVKEVR